MKGTLAFDPREHDYGPATAAVRTLLLEWAAIDWFVPPGSPRQVANDLFTQHNALARAYAPELFADRVKITSATGGWADFVALCNGVRTQTGWDWKYSALKRLSSAHSTAHGWLLKNQGQNTVPGTAARPGELFLRFGDQVYWGHFSPPLDFRSIGAEWAESASFYSSYCDMDFLECLQWQLAEGRDELAGNPFIPLCRCYAAGYYPFSLSSTAVVMFSFAPTSPHPVQR